MTETTPSLRVRAYLARLDRARGQDREEIHGFDVGEPSEAVLRATDLRALLAEVEARRQPQADFDRRVSDLLEANNRYQQEGRDARADAQKGRDVLTAILKMLYSEGDYRGGRTNWSKATDLAVAAGVMDRPAPVAEQQAAPPAPWKPGAADNAKIEGWMAFFTGRDREACPFPPARDDLQRDYRVGWDAAQAKRRGTGSRG